MPGPSIDKPATFHDPDARAGPRNTCCEYCGRTGEAIHWHHVKSRGAGGGDETDNRIDLCWKCHDLTHRGLISRAELLAIIERRAIVYDVPPIDPAQATSPFFSDRPPVPGTNDPTLTG